MAAGDSMGQGQSSPLAVDWSNLLDDLLGMIRSRIACSRGRIRFAAVCRSWRAAASQLPATPAVPLLILALHVWGKKKKHLYCPEEGRVLQVPVPSKLHAYFIFSFLLTQESRFIFLGACVCCNKTGFDANTTCM
jgi:hypothetical protein